MEKHGGKYAHIADSAFECAWEYAREIVKTDPSLSMWFDRSVFNDPYSAISSIPRVIGSRSFYCESKNKYPVKQTKNYLKISYLSSSSEELRGANLDDWVIDHPTLKNIKRDFSEFIF
jgi:hypothetical protein